VRDKEERPRTSSHPRQDSIVSLPAINVSQADHPVRGKTYPLLSLQLVNARSRAKDRIIRAPDPERLFSVISGGKEEGEGVGSSSGD